MPTASDYACAIDELRRARRIVITLHVKPDADALGSAAALRRWLVAQGKTVEVVVPTSPAPKFAYLDPDGVVRVAGRDVRVSGIAAPDLVVVLDTGTWLQLEGMAPLVGESGAPVLVIDHHRTQDPLADFLLADPDAAATVILVHRLLLEAGAAIDDRTATFLLAGLVSDTDWFRLPNVTPDVLRLAADLVAAGARPPEIFERLYQCDPLPRVHVMGRAMETLRQVLDGRVTIMSLPRALFRETGADIGDTENLINECMRVRGTRVGVMLVEADPDTVRVSLRCQPGLNVLEVAKRFGGGGHIRAAGCRVKASLDAAEARVLEAVQAALDAANAPESP